jgi:enterochelin esterase family protein
VAPPPAASPLIGDRGATFVWLGDEPAPVVIGAWCGWDPDHGLRMERGEGGWAAWLELPPDAYVEYAFIREGRRVRDPLNPHRVANGVRGSNAQLWMPAASRRAAALHRRHVPRGTVRRGHIRLGWRSAPPRDRRLDLYLPSERVSHDRAALPLLIVLDGADYLDRGHLDRTLDGLIAAGRMAPVAAAFLDNGGEARAAEYAANDFTLSALVDEVAPAARARLGLPGPAAGDGDGEGGAVILGSSLGGLMAVHAATRRPGFFGGAIAQSTAAFLGDPDPSGDARSPLTLTTLELLRRGPQPGSRSRLWLDVGDFETLAESSDRLVELLRGAGHEVISRHYPTGHDQTSWADRLIDALPAMFPPG